MRARSFPRASSSLCGGALFLSDRVSFLSLRGGGDYDEAATVAVVPRSESRAKKVPPPPRDVAAMALGAIHVRLHDEPVRGLDQAPSESPRRLGFAFEFAGALVRLGISAQGSYQAASFLSRVERLDLCRRPV